MSYDECIKKAEAIIAQLEQSEAISLDEYKRLAAAYSMDVEDVKSRMGAEDVKTDLLARKAGALIADNAVAVAEGCHVRNGSPFCGVALAFVPSLVPKAALLPSLILAVPKSS